MTYREAQVYHLPAQQTPFVGRETEIADIVARLEYKACRLLTLVGSGGIGKTRLCIELIQKLHYDNFVHGVYYVPLAPLNDSENIVTTIVNILGIAIRDKTNPHNELIQYLSHRNLLLVMDNFEHLIAGSDLITDILQQTSEVKILVTSRETLNLSMEYVWHVKGMRYPTSFEPESINQYDALNLFIERALQIRRDFSLSDEQVAMIEICQLLDGMPLAIELATSWLKTLSCQDILHQIQAGIDILKTRNRDIADRHRSIYAVFDHSWDLLTNEEQMVFPLLSIFRGGFTLEAAQRVAQADLITLSGLVEKSMIRHNPNGRYDLHELLRQYGEYRLEASQNTDQGNQSHLNYYVDFVSSRVPDLKGLRQVDSLKEIRADLYNVRVAWIYATDKHMFDALHNMLEAIQICFDLLRYPPLSNDLYGYTLEQLESIEHDHIIFHNRLQICVWYLEWKQNNIQYYDDDMLEQIDQRYHIAETHNDQVCMMLCIVLRRLIFQEPDSDTYIKQMREIASQLDEYYQCIALEQISYYYTVIANNNSQTTVDCMEEFLALSKTINNVYGVAAAYSHLAQFTRFWGDLDQALVYYNLALAGSHEIENELGVVLNNALPLLISFKKGQFEYVVQHLPHYIETFNRLGFFANHRFVNMTMAKSYALLGYYTESQRYLKKVHASIPDNRVRTLFHIHEAQAMIAIGLGDIQKLRTELSQALTLDIAFVAPRLKLDFLPLVMFLYCHNEQHDEAIELYDIIFAHPLATTGWMLAWRLFTDLIETIEAYRSTSDDQSKQNHRVDDSLDSVFEDIRAYVGVSSAPQSQPLVEPLTKRELHVLALLGEGYSNQQIADELIIALGTVKSHVYKICQKLSVKNRTQAVLEAKELGILP